MSDIYDVVQAFADGEAVDPVELEAALAHPDGRAHLIDIVTLRKLVKGTTAVASMPAGARTLRHPLRWIAAAAMVVISASVGGYFVGERASSDVTSVAIPPVAVTDPGNQGNQNPVPAAVPPPAPTTVYRFQPGVDWTERGGY